MSIYKHRQISKIAPVFFVVFAVLYSVISVWRKQELLTPAITIAFVAVVFLLFYSLIIEVKSNHLTLRFGIGVFRKTYRFDALCHPKVIRCPWYYGWGIRRIPRGWLFNVAGFDAVELQLKNKANHRVCIGTDEPEILLSVLQTVLGEADES